MPTPKELLLDPMQCGEDLRAIANRAFELAPQLCGQCMSYHMRVPATRAAGLGASLSLDRKLIVEAVQHMLRSTQIRDRREPEIAIIGNADTGLLATCAHAAAGLGEDLLARTTFTVVDICPTPLALCSEFATKHGLKVKASAFDIATGEVEHPVDIVFMHSILRFIPADKRAAVLRRFAQKLRPGGKLLVSNLVSSPAAKRTKRLDPRREKTLEKILALFAAGKLKSNFGTTELHHFLGESFLTSQNRDFAIADVEGATALFQQAGLQIERVEINTLSGQDELGVVVRHRLLAVLSIS